MTATNFAAALAFVWRAGFDSPISGPHDTRGDPGGLTLGGITAATWDDAVTAGLVKGALATATIDQLTTILRAKYWGSVCNALPEGLDLLMFNGRMMSGYFPRIFQQALGLLGPEDVDGWIGPESLALAKSREPETFIDAVTGAHGAYLANLTTWIRFGAGWTTRLKAAQAAALALANQAPLA